MDLHDDSAVIEKAGGPSVIARLCEISPQAVSQWRKAGIPRARRMYLELKLPDAFLAAGASAKTPPAAEDEAA